VKPQLVLFHPSPKLPHQIQDISIFEFDLIENTRSWAGGWKSLEELLEDGWIVIGRFDEDSK